MLQDFVYESLRCSFVGSCWEPNVTVPRTASGYASTETTSHGGSQKTIHVHRLLKIAEVALDGAVWNINVDDDGVNSRRTWDWWESRHREMQVCHAPVCEFLYRIGVLAARCVNPSHSYLGRPSGNSDDAALAAQMESEYRRQVLDIDTIIKMFCGAWDARYDDGSHREPILVGDLNWKGGGWIPSCPIDRVREDRSRHNDEPFWIFPNYFANDCWNCGESLEDGGSIFTRHQLFCDSEECQKAFDKLRLSSG